jgi:hypothetical protein
MTGILVDAAGELWPDTSLTLQKSFRAELPAPEFCKFSVTNLGFAHIGRARNGLALAWRPTTLTGTTFAGLMIALSDEQPARVSIATLTEDWSFELVPSIESARRRLIEVFNTATCEQEGHYLARRRRLESLRSDDHLSRLLNALQNAGDEISSRVVWSVLEKLGKGRFVLVKPDQGKPSLPVITWGVGYKRFTPDWALRRAGQAFEEQPDRAYARYASAGYREAFHRGETVLEDVTTSTWWPGRGRTRFTYTRLLLPLNIEGKGICVLSSSQDITLVESGRKLAHEV